MFSTIVESRHQGAPPYGAYPLERQIMLLEPPTIYRASLQLCSARAGGLRTEKHAAQERVEPVQNVRQLPYLLIPHIEAGSLLLGAALELQGGCKSLSLTTGFSGILNLVWRMGSQRLIYYDNPH